MNAPVLNGEHNIIYRWHIRHRPEMGMFVLHMYRYDANRDKRTRHALTNDGHWLQVAEGTEAPYALMMPDILVHHLGEHGVVNFFDGRKTEDVLTEWCTKMIMAIEKEPDAAPV